VAPTRGSSRQRPAHDAGYSWAKSTTPFGIDPGTVVFWTTVAIDLGGPVPRACSLWVPKTVSRHATC
jgi:hypothetical protein